MRDDPPLIDTNILVYAYDRTEGRKHEAARLLMTECWNNARQYSISTQNLSEFYVIATQKVTQRLKPTEAEAVVLDILNFAGWTVISPTPKTVKSAMGYNVRYATPYWDSLLAATMLENDISTIYTENERDFKRIPHLKVINPLD